MATIIALRGKADSRKSTVIMNLIDSKFDSSDVRLIKEHKGRGKNKGKVVDKVVTIKQNRIGITSRGDYKKILEEDFNLMGECDAYVCACRTKGGTQEFLNEKIANGDNVIIINKDLQKLDQDYVELIYDKIKEFM